MGGGATQKMRFETTSLVLEAAFDGGRLTSDGGLIWLAKADEELGVVCEEIASHIPEWRGPSVRHSLVTLLRQRVLQIACGYEDRLRGPERLGHLEDRSAVEDGLREAARDGGRLGEPADDLAA